MIIIHGISQMLSAHISANFNDQGNQAAGKQPVAGKPDEKQAKPLATMAVESGASDTQKKSPDEVWYFASDCLF